MKHPVSRIHWFGTIVAMLALAFSAVSTVYPAAAATSSTGISISGITYSFTATGTHDDGGGTDEVMVVCYNPDSSISDTDAFHITVGTNSTITGTCSDINVAGFSSRSQPLQVRLYDVPGGVLENDASAFGLIQSSPLLGSSFGYSGPPIPAGFVLKTITCTIAVFDAPDGNAVPGAVVTQGQTWYVNPKAVKDGKGKSWTEIFVSGVPNGFVWSSCVK